MAFAEAVKAKFSPPPLSSSQGHPAWGHGYGGGLLDTRGGGLLPANAVARGHRGRPHGSVLQLAVGCGVALFLVFTVYKTHVLEGRASALAVDGRRMGPQDEDERLQPSVRHPFPQLRNLVVVAGHSVFVGSNFADAMAPENWYLEPYQQVPGQVESFVQHIQLGVQAAAEDPTALLLFSGGQTRLVAGTRSEGASYWGVADALQWFDHPEVKGRTALEEAARDSFENVAFSLCRFHQLTGHYPDTYTVVSYDFKRWRFTELHRAALHFPAERFFFVGTPALSPRAAAEGEAATLERFKSDPYGCRGELRAKREGRNPFAVVASYGGGGECPEMRGILRHCGGRAYAGRLPWQS